MTQGKFEMTQGKFEMTQEYIRNGTKESDSSSAVGEASSQSDTKSVILSVSEESQHILKNNLVHGKVVFCTKLTFKKKSIFLLD